MTAPPPSALLPIPRRDPLGRWDLAEASAWQKNMRDLLMTCDRIGAVRRVAGADVASDRRDRRLHAAVVVLDAQTLETIETASVRCEASFPYIPGFLTFREAPAIQEAFAALRVKPDLLLVDGHGLAHPRGFGIACHLGLALDIPSIGVAKTVLVGRHLPPGSRAGSTVPLVHAGRSVGAVVRTRTGVAPVYVSVGHRVGLDTAIRWTLALARGVRMPEPTRRADATVRALRARACP